MPVNKGISIIISSPSGAGKTTITKKILKKVKNTHLSISCTTRKPRKNERNGVDYFFITKNKFFNLKKNKRFLEYAKVYDNYYGTLNSQVKKIKNKKIVLFDVDWQGARSIKKKINKNCYSFFLLPPSRKILKERLLKRHPNDPSTALKRFSSAKKDISHWVEYDYVFINDNLKKCVNSILKKVMILLDEKERTLSVFKKIRKL